MLKRIFLHLIFVALIASNVTAQEVNNTSKLWTIKECVNQFDATKTSPTAVGYQYWFVDKNLIDGQTLKLSVVAPHKATHPPHKHTEDEFFFVLEGKARFYLAGDTVVCGPYTSFYCPSLIEHGISNAGDTELKYLVIKKYQPTK